MFYIIIKKTPAGSLNRPVELTVQNRQPNVKSWLTPSE